MFATIPSIPGHAVFLLLVQLALLLLVARVGALLARAIGLPAVVGELLAGIVLGPSLFGHYAPEAFAAVFPQTSEQFHLLETVGLLGMVFLLLLTGLETDLKLLRNLGRAAIVASVLGMVVPFGAGFGLGVLMPDAFLENPDQRMLFASFLATAMAISAMPVIAKILMDLDLMRRNIGLVILSAGVVDDTAGWLILSVIASAATQSGGPEITQLFFTVGFMLAYLLATAAIAYPLLRVLFRFLSRYESHDTELTVIVIFSLLCAGLTEAIGVHAVFGAFIAGTALRQLPHLREQTVHRLESFAFTILAPIFFGTVGLKVDLWSLSGGGGTMLAIVLGIACFGKLAGCTLGGVWGGMSFWEAVSIAVAMNARGAMGLVVASIGLSLGILNVQMYSIIVVVAIVTSFMAPVLLRLTMRLVRMTREEEQRILAEQSRGAFDVEKLRVLLPTAGGERAVIAARFAHALTRKSSNPLEVVHVDETTSSLGRVLGFFRRGPRERASGIEDHLGEIRDLGGDRPPRIRQVRGAGAAAIVVSEAQKGVDLVVLTGGSGRIAEEVVNRAPCHVAIVKAGSGDAKAMSRVFVPIDGSSVSKIAAELALHYAQAVGGELTLGMLSERLPAAATIPEESPDTVPGSPGLLPPKKPARTETETEEAELLRVSPVFRIAKLKPKVQRIEYEPGLGTVADAIRDGHHDVVVLGAENRAVRRQLFFGHENQRIIDLASVTTVILVPKPER